MYSTDLAVTLKNHCCLTWLHSALFCIPQTLLSHNCTSKLNSTELSLFIHSTDTALTTLSFYSFHRHGSHCQHLLLGIQGTFCCISAPCSHSFSCKLDSILLVPSTDLALILNSHYCPSKFNSTLFMHSTDLTRTANDHYCAFKLNSALFMHSTDLAITLMSH